MKLMIDQSLNLCESDDNHSISMKLRIDGLIRLIATEYGDHMFTAQSAFWILQVSKKTNRKEEKEAEEGRLDRCKGET
jgi:hypothetical protein